MLAPLLFVFGVFVWRIMETKICRKCGKEFELDHFYISKSNKDGEKCYRLCKQRNGKAKESS